MSSSLDSENTPPSVKPVRSKNADQELTQRPSSITAGKIEAARAAAERASHLPSKIEAALAAAERASQLPLKVEAALAAAERAARISFEIETTVKTAKKAELIAKSLEPSVLGGLKSAQMIEAFQNSGLKQVEIAAQLGISQSKVSRLLRQGTPVSSVTPPILRTSSSNSESTEDAEKISVTIPPRMAAIADDLGLDLATLFTTIGMDAVRAELKRRLADHDREAIQAQNAYFAEHGLPLAKYRTW